MFTLSTVILFLFQFRFAEPNVSRQLQPYRLQIELDDRPIRMLFFSLDTKMACSTRDCKPIIMDIQED